MGDDDGSGDRVWDIPFLPALREEDLGGMMVSEKLKKLRDGREDKFRGRKSAVFENSFAAENVCRQGPFYIC
jgi:hypothetical protein